MLNLFLSIVAFGLLVALLFARKTESTRQIIGFKAVLSSLFVVAAAIQPRHETLYFQLIFTGLACGLVGDVFLALPGKNPFKIGLAAFMVGHVAYVAAFVSIAEPANWFNPVMLVYAVAGAAVFKWIYPYLRSMAIPVGIYAAVITVMMISAFTASLGSSMPTAARPVILLGSICFGASDVLIAKERFVESRFVNRLIYLPLYYCGQFLIAFSVGMVG